MISFLNNFKFIFGHSIKLLNHLISLNNTKIMALQNKGIFHLKYIFTTHLPCAIWSHVNDPKVYSIWFCPKLSPSPLYTWAKRKTIYLHIKTYILESFWKFWYFLFFSCDGIIKGLIATKKKLERRHAILLIELTKFRA